MLGSFSSMLDKLKTTKIGQNIKQNYNKIKEHIKPKLNFIEIIPKIYHIDFPDNQNVTSLIQHIGERDFQIWNISEYQYDKQIENKLLRRVEQGEIHHLCFEYYSNLPLYQLMIAINSIHSFLAINFTNRLYLHCQDNKIRSGVFLACLLYKFHILNMQDLSEAILYINKKLQINLQVGQVGEGSTGKYKNLHVFFKNFINFVNNPSVINQNQLEIIKIIVNQAPKLKVTNQVLVSGATVKQLKVGLQIRCKQQIIFNNIYANSVFQGDSLCLNLDKKTIILSDDFLVIFKYIFKGKIYNVMRAQMNTNFIYQNFYRTHIQSIDLSAYCFVDDSAGMFIDFMFQGNNQQSSLSRLGSIAQQQKQIQQTKQTKIKNEDKQVQSACKNNEYSFSLEEHDQQSVHPQLDENEINRKIEQVIKNINNKLSEQLQEQQEQDLDDYLTKLQSQI